MGRWEWVDYSWVMLISKSPKVRSKFLTSKINYTRLQYEYILHIIVVVVTVDTVLRFIQYRQQIAISYCTRNWYQTLLGSVSIYTSPAPILVKLSSYISCVAESPKMSQWETQTVAICICRYCTVVITGTAPTQDLFWFSLVRPKGPIWTPDQRPETIFYFGFEFAGRFEC
jgi:hypothetical protein